MNPSMRVLVIAYDFPPHGAIGTMRTLRLVRQLCAEGHDVTVLTGSPETYLPGTPVERGLEAQVPAGVDVLQVRAIRPVNAFERMLRGKGRPVSGTAVPSPAAAAPAVRKGKRAPWVEALLSVRNLVESALEIPDKESGWITPAIVRGVRHMARSGRPDVIYSSAPPWSGQVVAWVLASLSRRPWVADFRDPWSRAPWRDWRPFRQRAIAALERRVVNRADAILFVTAANLAEFASFHGPSAAARFRLVPNGCDPTELESVPPLPPREPFVLLHAGTLYGERSPMPVIRAIARGVSRGAIDPARFRLRLLGNVSLAVDVPDECRKLGILEVVEFVSRVTRAESLQEMKSASALLLVQTGTTVSVPGKAYEYLAAGRPVLALSEEGETSALVRASGIGVSVTPDAPVEAIEAALLQVIALAGRPFPPAPAALYDGRVHAVNASLLLREFAGAPQSAAPPAAVVAAAGSSKESRQ